KERIAEKNTTEEDEEEENESAQAASAAGQLVRVREDIITHLIRSTWSKAGFRLQPEAVCEVDALEKLRFALARNVDQTLAIEVACLRIAGLV
ncbi:hypothetical protein EBX31_14245, partial [bacterium]|nr:hypothetical protein [bacterium]